MLGCSNAWLRSLDKANVKLALTLRATSSGLPPWYLRTHALFGRSG